MIKFEKSWIGTRRMTINDKVSFFLGTTDHWGIAIGYNHYDRCFSIEFLHWYFGVEVYHAQ